MKKKNNLAVLISCCLVIASSVGILVNAAGVFFTPVSEELGVGKGAISLTLTISNIAFAIGGMFTVKCIHERNFKKMLLLLAVVYSVSTLLLSVCNSVYLMYVLSVFRGFTAGMSGIVLVTILVNNHYESNTGLMTSIALGCSGLAGALLSPIFTMLIESVGWRMTYVISSVLTFVCYLPAILLPFGMNNKIKEVSHDNNEVVKEVVSEKKDYKKELILVSLFAFFIISVTALSQHFPSMAINANTGALMVSVCMVCNTSSKVIMGALSDKFGVEKPTIAFGVCTLIGLVLLATVNNELTQLLAAGLIGMVYSLGAVSAVLLSRKVFGDAYNKYYPTVSLIGTISGAIFASIVGFMYDIFSSYTQAIWMMFILAIIALCCVYLLSKTNKSMR